MKKPPVVVPLLRIVRRRCGYRIRLRPVSLLRVEGTFTIPVVSVMLEGYDSARRPAIRSDKSTPPQNGDNRGHLGPPHRRLRCLAISLLARRVNCWRLLQGSSKAGLQNGLRYLDERSQLGETPSSIFEISV